jgi:hexosaminidase
VSQHRRRAPAKKIRQRRYVVAAAFAGTVALGTGLGVWASTGGSGTPGAAAGTATTHQPSDARSDAAAGVSRAPSPTPTRTYPMSTAPSTIPAVRSHTPARGPGWKPARGERVVVSDPELADEGRLIAGELGLAYAGEAKDVRTGDVRLALNDDEGANPESYSMTVRGGRVVISGPGEAGVFYGTRTLKQEVHGGGTAPEGVVRDEPAKPVRGLMIDIARKPYGVNWLKDRVRELGDLKFNRLGLHFSDDQGFRIESSTHPEVVSKDRLTKAQVKEIVDLAAQRHITVVPEIDSPGHLGAVIDAHPDLQLRSAAGRTPRGALDITQDKAAAILDDLLEEYSGLFPDGTWHLGGDEYVALMASNPAASYPQLAAAAREAYGSGGTIADLTTGWLNDRADAVRAPGRTLVAWNDGFFRNTSVQPAKDIQVAYWTGKEIGARPPLEYLKAGRTVLNYNDEYLYYVLGQPNQFVYPTGKRIYEEWTPRVLRGSTAVPASYDAQIPGGFFAVWGDLPNSQTQAQVADGIRMPLRAMVQKLWNPGKPSLTWTQFRALADRLG